MIGDELANPRRRSRDVPTTARTALAQWALGRIRLYRTL